MADKPSDKAPWTVAATGLFQATLAGAKAGEDAFPEMQLEEVEVNWAARPKFEGNVVLADTDEPGVQAFTSRVLYKRHREPKL